MSSKFSRYGILFVISAPSGAGKTTLVDALRETAEFVYSVSCTTRPPRTGEIDGEDYRFLSEQDFLAQIGAGEFLEHAKVHDHHYGTPLQPVLANLKDGRDVLIDICQEAQRHEDEADLLPRAVRGSVPPNRELPTGQA